MAVCFRGLVTLVWSLLLAGEVKAQFDSLARCNVVVSYSLWVEDVTSPLFPFPFFLFSFSYLPPPFFLPETLTCLRHSAYVTYRETYQVSFHTPQSCRRLTYTFRITVFLSSFFVFSSTPFLPSQSTTPNVYPSNVGTNLGTRVASKVGSAEDVHIFETTYVGSFTVRNLLSSHPKNAWQVSFNPP